LNDKPSTLGARVSGRRAGQRFDAENGVVTEALIFLGDLDPEAIGPNIEHATHYEPTPVTDFDALIAHVPFACEKATFVDIGSGMGRVVLLAARRAFRQVVGLEISRALHEVARDNLARAGTTTFACRDVRLVRGDAATYRFPRGPLVVYLYNPFDAFVLTTVLDQLVASPSRPLAIVYHTPVERATLDAHPGFRLVAEEPSGVVYCGTDSRLPG
jgi:SAM-dependent methyltransferase